MPGKEEIIFQGAKPYWRTRNTVDVKLVLHTALDVIEIVCYEPAFGKEASRIYVRFSSVIANLDQEEIGRKLEEVKEPILRRRQVPDNAALLKEVVQSSASEYILNRLHISEFDAEKRSFSMEIKPTARDAESAQPDCTNTSQILCAKPRKLPMFKSPLYHTLLDGLADQMLEPVRDEKTGLKMLRRTGLLYTNQERWRIPIIFVKVRNGRILTPSDARLWCIVTRAIDLDVVTLAVAKALDVKLTDRATTEAPKPAVGKSVMPLKTNLAAINTDLTAINTAFNTKESRTPLTYGATPKSRHHPGRSSFADTSGVSGISSPSISPTKRAQLNRAPTGMPRNPFSRVNTAASSGSLLAGITASMKKRFSMGLTYEYNEDEEGEPNKAAPPASPHKLRGKPKAVPLKKTKTARSGTDSPSAEEEECVDEPEPEDTFGSSSISQRISAGFSAFSTSIKRTLSFKPKLSAAASQAAFGLHEGADESDEDVGFENEGKESSRDEPVAVNAGTAPTLKLENPSPSPSPSPKSVAVPPSPERKKVNYAVACDSNKPAALSSKPSVSPKTKKSNTVAPKVHSRVASMRSGAMLDTARSTTSDADALQNASSSGSAPVTPVSAPPQTAEEFRDAMLKKQSTKTASAVRSMNSRASFRANTYGLEDSDASTSNSPIAQFFSKMTPTWAVAANRVLPTESAEVAAN